jgi:hypothetical protein
MAGSAVLLLSAASVLNAQRNVRNDREYLKLHPSPIERVKEHIRSNPSQ